MCTAPERGSSQSRWSSISDGAEETWERKRNTIVMLIFLCSLIFRAYEFRKYNDTFSVCTVGVPKRPRDQEDRKWERERERETYCSHHQRGSWTCGDHRCKWTCCCWRAASAGTAQLSYWSSRWKLCTLRVHLRRLPRSCKWEIVPPSDSPAQKDLMSRKDLEDARKWSPLEHPRPHSQF